MSDSDNTTASQPNTLGGLATTVGGWAGFAGLVCLLVGLLLGFAQGDNQQHLLHSYVLSYAYFLSLSLGAMFFVLILHLTKAGWGVVLRRMAELTAANMPVLALMGLPIVVLVLTGNYALYEWNNPEVLVPSSEAFDPLVYAKRHYLNPYFFAVRIAVYFAVWIGLSRYYLSRSRKQDDSGDPQLTLDMEWMSAPAMLLFAGTTTFASIDLLMSLDPHWFSTIFGVYYFAGCAVGWLATLSLFVLGLQKVGCLGDEITVEHRQDVGKLMFGFLIFWAYVSFSQYMLIWYGNIPEETNWYAVRQEGIFPYIGIALVVLGFAVPFLGLVSRHVKRNPFGLAFWSIWLLVMHYVDLFYVVAPNLKGEGAVVFSWADPFMFVGIGGLWLAGLVRLAGSSTPLVPQADPRLAESLQFKNV